MNTEELIKKTVKETVLQLKIEGLMKDRIRSPQEKTEDLLKHYTAFTTSEEPVAGQMIQRIEMALSLIREDPYYDVIIMYYIKGMSREEIADQICASVTTVSRNKHRLIKDISAVLFADDYIRQLYMHSESL